jgi:hypothetical protein
MYLNNIIVINPMDYIRYSLSTFEEHKSVDPCDPLFIKLQKNVATLKENYSCFRDDFVPVQFYMNTTWSKNDNKKFQNKNKPKHIIKCSINNNESLSLVTSGLNKLTMSNYDKIYSKVIMKIDNNLMKETVNLILQTNNNASLFNELYVGLIFHIFHLSNNETKKIITSECSSYIKELFDKSLYIVNDCNETYDMFCSRIKNKHELISRIRAFFFLTQHNDFTVDSYSFSDLVFYIFNMLNEIITDEAYIVQSEQLLDALIACFTLNDQLYVPTINDKINTKILITQQNLKLFEELCENLTQYETYCSYKIKFKIQDLENCIKLY